MDLKPKLQLFTDFIKEPQILFEFLQTHVSWDERMNVRKTASFGVAYNYSGINYPETPMLNELVPICEKIEQYLNYCPNNCLMNYYSDGNSSMGFHSDSLDNLQSGTGVAILSLGSERTIQYKHKLNRITVDDRLPKGSLLYMDDNVQREWLHAIPKEDNAEERISLTFRQMMAR